MALNPRALPVILMLLLPLSLRVWAADAAPNPIPSPATVRAYNEFWRAFDIYEQSVIKKGKEKYESSWLSIREARKKDELDYSQKQLKLLENAAYEYEEHIKSNPFAENLPYVYLNLAQVQSEIAGIKSTLDEDGSLYLQQAVQVLSKLESEFPTFPQSEATLYLKAMVLSRLGNDKDALVVWNKLARLAKNSLYGVHAKIAVADQLFKAEQSSNALTHYEDALRLLSSIDTDEGDYESLRIQYRIVWAAYRAAQLPKAIEAGIQILTPGRHIRHSDIRTRIEDDAIQLLGDSLYEYNDFEFTKEVLRRKVLNDFSARIAMRTMKNYVANRISEEAIAVGNYILDLYPVSTVAPDIIIMVADAYRDLGREDARIKALERLALFLPNDSLWRTRHHENFAMTSEMEQKSLAATNVIAEHYYQKGMKTGNPQFFESASTYLTILLNQNANSEESVALRLKRGHCYYFSDRYQQASDQYDELVADLKIDVSTLKIAAFQSIMAREKIWRESYAKIADGQGNPIDHPLVIENLRRLELVVERFANRFPPKMESKNSEHAIDSLLIAASANRDHERYKVASKYWQRVLISNPTIGQRTIAIRSLVHAKVKGATPLGIVEISRRFLRLENWQQLGSTLNAELHGILSSAVVARAEELTSGGRHAEAGVLLVDVAQEFPKLPKRARIYRDGAYYLAMGGNWNEAEKRALTFLAQKMSPYADDMSYLKARSQEFQMRFQDSSQSYFAHASSFPKHTKVVKALERSEVLARGESNWPLAAKASLSLAKISKTQHERIAYFKKSYESYMLAEDFEAAQKIAKSMLSQSKSLDEELAARLDLALVYMKIREEDYGLGELKTIVAKASQAKDKINAKVFAEVYGQANFLLGEEERAQFSDFRLEERGGDLKDALQKKLLIFERMFGHYQQAVRSNHPLWTAQSRFVMGLESDRLSDEIQAVIKTRNTADALTTVLNQHSERLRTVARTNYSANLLASSRSPRDYHDNTWVKKSMLKLNGYLKAKEDFKSIEYGPAALSLNIPSQWSH